MSATLLALLPVVLLAPVPKDLEAKIKWRLAKGDVFYVTTKDSANSAVVMNMMGQVAAPVKATSSTTATLKYEVVSAGDTVRVVKVTVLSREVVTEQDGLPQAQETPDLKGATVTLTLDKNFEVTKVDGFKALTERFGDDVTGMGGYATEKGFAEGLRQVFAVVPPKGINRGAKWERKASFADAMGTLNRTARCTAAELNDATGHVVIDTLSDYKWEAAEGKDDPKGVVAKIVSGDLKGKDCKGTVTFDPKRGRLVGSREVIQVAGTFNLKLDKTPINMSLKSTVTRTVTVSDKAPEGK